MESEKFQDDFLMVCIIFCSICLVQDVSLSNHMFRSSTFVINMLSPILLSSMFPCFAFQSSCLILNPVCCEIICWFYIVPSAIPFIVISCVQTAIFSDMCFAFYFLIALTGPSLVLVWSRWIYKDFILRFCVQKIILLIFCRNLTTHCLLHILPCLQTAQGMQEASFFPY